MHACGGIASDPVGGPTTIIVPGEITISPTLRPSPAGLQTGHAPCGYLDWLGWAVLGNMVGGIGLVTLLRLVRSRRPGEAGPGGVRFLTDRRPVRRRQRIGLVSMWTRMLVPWGRVWTRTRSHRT